MRKYRQDLSQGVASDHPRDISSSRQLTVNCQQPAVGSQQSGETATATDALEVLCLANELYESELLNRLIVELAAYGKVEEYAEKRGTDEGADLIVEVLGKDKALRILQDVANEVKRQSKVGTGENDKVKASDRCDPE